MAIKSHNPRQASKSNDPWQQTQASKMSPSDFAITAVTFKIYHRRRHLQALPLPLSPSRSGTTTIAFKLCHRRCHLQALLLPLSFATE
nr:hypothetical protein CFP56_01611 [Quercus suber]